MAWKVRKEDVGYFIGDLWKDLRHFAPSEAEDEFGKDCFSEADAAFEAVVLRELGRSVASDSVPRVHRVEGSVLYMERVSGIRLFDLIRHLRAFEMDGNPVAETARFALMRNAGGRLREIQLALASMVESGIITGITPYPLELKVNALLNFFVRVLDLRAAPKGWVNEVAEMQTVWTESYAYVPFRDATTKNMIARIAPPTGITDTNGDLESWQRAHVLELLKGDPAYWEQIVIADIDFSSVMNSSSPEDDPISLFFHQWTAGTIPLSTESLLLDPRLGEPDSRRAALTLLVRYLRFGGRKLAYQLVNSQGFAVRFAFDDPLYYFENVRAHCEKLEPGFSSVAPDLLALMELIAHTVRSASPQDRQIMQIDHLRRFGLSRDFDYWQQSPLEGLHE